MRCSRYYRSRLAEGERTSYDTIVKAMERMAPEVTVLPHSQEAIGKILYALNFDNAHLHYVDFGKCQIWKSPAELRIVLAYKYPREEVMEYQRKLEKAVAPIVRDAAGKHGMELALYLHDRLVRMGTYGTNPDKPDDAHTIIGLLLHSLCVCEGYAKAFKYLADQTGLSTIVVTGYAMHPDGTGGGHAWNIIKVAGTCYQVDVTFDQLVGKRFCSHAFFALSTREILYDHQFDPDFPYPDCPEYGGTLKKITGTRALMDYLEREAKSGATHTEVRLSKGFPDGQLMDMISRKLEPKDWGWYRKVDAFWYGQMSKSLFITWK